MQPTEQLDIILPRLSDLVDQIEPSTLENPTPCDAFTLHDVLDHIIVLGGSFAYLFRGEDPPELEPSVREVVAAVDGFVREALTDDLRDGDTFKTATGPPEGATAIERLAAFSGRTV